MDRSNLPQGADSIRGVKANLKYIFWHKLWATLIVFALGFVAGMFASGIFPAGGV